MTPCEPKTPATYTAAVVAVIDSDQHLFESRTLWSEHLGASEREDALAIVDDELGYPWLTWRGRRLALAEVQRPGTTSELGRHRQRRQEGLAPDYTYDEELPAAYWEPSARRDQLTAMGLDAAVVFPNFGLLWERRLSGCLPALLANMGAWNRWCAEVVAEGRGRLHPVAHLTLRDPVWLEAQLEALAAAGVRLAMIAPAAVDGRPLSHPDFDRSWAAFVEHGISPLFHVADQPRLLDEAFYGDPEDVSVPVLESVFLWVPAAVAVTDLIVQGVFERHPGLRVGIVELSSIWVPQYLLMLDGGFRFVTALNGEAPAPLSLLPSEYFRRQVRVSSFSYEQPGRLIDQAGDLFMACSDYPHSEGTATPLEDYAATRHGPPKEASAFFYDNVSFLLAS